MPKIISRPYRDGAIDRARLVRNLALEIAGIIITIGLAVFLSWLAASYLSAYLTGMGGLVIILLAALAVGALAGLLMQRTWGRLLAK